MGSMLIAGMVRLAVVWLRRVPPETDSFGASPGSHHLREYPI